MGDVGSARYEPALLPPCPTIRVLCYSNCRRSTHSHQHKQNPSRWLILVYHPELSGCITTLTVRNGGLQNVVQQWTPWLVKMLIYWIIRYVKALECICMCYRLAIHFRWAHLFWYKQHCWNWYYHIQAFRQHVQGHLSGKSPIRRQFACSVVIMCNLVVFIENDCRTIHCITLSRRRAHDIRLMIYNVIIFIYSSLIHYWWILSAHIVTTLTVNS